MKTGNGKLKVKVSYIRWIKCDVIHCYKIMFTILVLWMASESVSAEVQDLSEKHPSIKHRGTTK